MNNFQTPCGLDSYHNGLNDSIVVHAVDSWDLAKKNYVLQKFFLHSTLSNQANYVSRPPPSLSFEVFPVVPFYTCKVVVTTTVKKLLVVALHLSRKNGLWRQKRRVVTHLVLILFGKGNDQMVVTFLMVFV